MLAFKEAQWGSSTCWTRKTSDFKNIFGDKYLPRNLHTRKFVQWFCLTSPNFRRKPEVTMFSFVLGEKSFQFSSIATKFKQCTIHGSYGMSCILMHLAQVSRSEVVWRFFSGIVFLVSVQLIFPKKVANKNRWMLPGDQRKHLTSNVPVNFLDANFRFDFLSLSFWWIEFQGGSIFRKLHFEGQVAWRQLCAKSHRCISGEGCSRSTSNCSRL